MKVKFLARSDAEDVLAQLAEKCESMDWAVAWARPHSKVLDAAYKHQRKFRRLIVGTHFHQTDPKVLLKFSKNLKAKMMLPDGDTFHPKIYLFRVGQEIAVIVGSHNLTSKAFSGNSEMSVMLRGAATDTVFQELNIFIEAEWQRAVSIAENIDAYELQHKTKQVHIKALEHFEKGVRKPLSQSDQPSPYALKWEDFIQLVKADRHGIDGRIQVLDGARILFERRKSLSKMTKQERKAIGGTYRKGEDELDNRPWGWFGTMSGNGDFSSLVNKSDLLSQALDKIPLAGTVDERHYFAFIDGFKRSFANASHKGDYATATRLLAMKRPDSFVGVNSRNVRSLCWAMGVPYTTLTLENYWELIASPLRQCPWWSYAAPHSGLERSIWDGRAALLDCVYYKPKSGIAAP